VARRVRTEANTSNVEWRGRNELPVRAVLLRRGELRVVVLDERIAQSLTRMSLALGPQAAGRGRQLHRSSETGVSGIASRSGLSAGASARATCAGRRNVETSGAEAMLVMEAERVESRGRQRAESLAHCIIRGRLTQSTEYSGSTERPLQKYVPIRVDFPPSRLSPCRRARLGE
jgi:hypothetical protein